MLHRGAPITIVGSVGGYAYRETVDSLGTQWANGTYGANSTYYGVTDVPWELGVADAAFVMVGKHDSDSGSKRGYCKKSTPWKYYPQNSFSVTYGPPVYYDAELRAVHNTYNPIQQDLFYVHWRAHLFSL